MGDKERQAVVTGNGTSKVKLCGMFRETDLVVVAEARPDYVGFIVNFPMSHRSVTPERLRALLAAVLLPPEIKRVGVFVDEPPANVARVAGECGLDAVQLHGHEDEGYLARLRPLLASGTELIQAFRVRTPEDVARAEASSADLVLLDNGQGTGECFDWSLVAHVERPFILAGGLTPENVASAIAAVCPYGVDMSSGIETDKLKDPAKILATVEAVCNA